LPNTLAAMLGPNLIVSALHAEGTGQTTWILCWRPTNSALVIAAAELMPTAESKL